MASHLIGLLGRKRSGKDTFAARLVAEHGYTRFAFADALRDAALALDPLIPIEADERYLLHWRPANSTPILVRLSTIVREIGWEKAKELREVRRTLQHMGTGVRALDEDFWLRVVMDKVAAHDGPAVITDVRFPNELDAVHAASGWSVRITRPGLPTDDLHISETALDEAAVDTLVFNNTDIVALYRSADHNARLVASL